LGTSAPLPVLIYSLTKAIFKNYSVQLIAENISIISIIISGVVLYQIIKCYSKSIFTPFVGGILLYSNLFFLMLFGHESIIAILFILTSILLVLKKRYILSAITIGLAFLCRAESLSVLPFLFIEIYQSKKHLLTSIKYLLFASLPILIWEIFSFIYFGQLTSNSLSFKIYQSQLTNSKFLPSLLSWINLIFTSKYFNWFILSISILGITYSSGSILILISCLLIIPIIFYSLINIAFYHWFIFLASIAIIFGIVQFLEKYHSSKIASYLIIAITVCSSLQTTQSYAKTLPQPRDFMYENIGKYFNQYGNHSDQIAFVEVGEIAYFSQKKIIDITGITNPDILKELKNGNRCYPYEFYQPEYIIYDPPFSWLTNPLKCDYVVKNYQIYHQFDSPNYRSLFLYKKI
jgi:hypothetical protein